MWTKFFHRPHPSREMRVLFFSFYESEIFLPARYNILSLSSGTNTEYWEAMAIIDNDLVERLMLT